MGNETDANFTVNLQPQLIFPSTGRVCGTFPVLDKLLFVADLPGGSRNSQGSAWAFSQLLPQKKGQLTPNNCCVLFREISLTHLGWQLLFKTEGVHRIRTSPP